MRQVAEAAATAPAAAAASYPLQEAAERMAMTTCTSSTSTLFCRAGWDLSFLQDADPGRMMNRIIDTIGGGGGGSKGRSGGGGGGRCGGRNRFPHHSVKTKQGRGTNCLSSTVRHQRHPPPCHPSSTLSPASESMQMETSPGVVVSTVLFSAQVPSDKETPSAPLCFPPQNDHVYQNSQTLLPLPDQCSPLHRYTDAYGYENLVRIPASSSSSSSSSSSLEATAAAAAAAFPRQSGFDSLHSLELVDSHCTSKSESGQHQTEPKLLTCHYQNITSSCIPTNCHLSTCQSFPSSETAFSLKRLNCDLPEAGKEPNCAATDRCRCQPAALSTALPRTTWDVERLAMAFRSLSLCRFYLGQMSFSDAKSLLQFYPVGTFLLRDSSDSRHLFSLSVQTRRGPTSIRIVFRAGLFSLDSEPQQQHLMPTFDCVIRLIQYYVRLQAGNHHSERSCGNSRNTFVLLEQNGRTDMPVILRKPYEKTPASLAHICRKNINGLLGKNNISRLQLIPSLKAFLAEYPYEI